MAFRLLAAASMALTLMGASAPQEAPMAGSMAGTRLQFDRVPINVALEAIVRRVSSKPFLLCDAALTDKRLISLRLEAYQLTIPIVREAVAAYGYRLTDRRGVLYVCDGSEGNRAAGQSASSEGSFPRGGAVAVPQGGYPAVGGSDARWDGYRAGDGASPAPWPVGSPLSPPAGPVAGPVPGMRLVQSELSGYRPDYVSPGALLAAVEPVFPGVKFSVITGEGQRPALFASGPVEDVARFKEMAAYLDRVPDAVEVQAIVLEVTSTDRSGFGVSMVLDALRSGIGFNIAGDQQSNSLTFHSGSFDGVLSAVAATSNAKVLSSPRLRGRSGEKLRLQVGADVPTLGTVVENPSGSTAQSIQYRSSGVIFEVVPTVFGKRIGLSVHQELSAFAATETGVRGSPTLSTRALDTTLDLESGEWAVIGGLTSQEDTLSRQSLLGLVPLGKTRVKRETELVLLVNVRRVQVQSRSAAVGPAGGQDVAARN